MAVRIVLLNQLFVAFFATALLVLFLPASSVKADTNPPFDLVPSSRVGQHRSVFFTCFDASERERFVASGFKMAIGSHLNSSGWRITATSTVKLRDFDAITGNRENRIHGSRVLIGYEWQFGSTAITAMAGGSFVRHSAGQAALTRRTGRFGPALALDVWHSWAAENATKSRYSALALSLDQAERSFYLRLRHGFSLPQLHFPVGPEASLSSGLRHRQNGLVMQDFWRTYRLGLHVAEIPVWRFRFTLSGGAEWRWHGRAGKYVHLAGYIPY